jgi:hypothetical protein
LNRSEIIQATKIACPSRKKRPFPKRRKGKKGGSLFFPILIVLSGVVVVFLSICTFYQKEVGLFLFEQSVIDRQFLPLLSKVSAPEEKMLVSEKLHDFYLMARSGEVEDQSLQSVSDHLQKIMLDQHLEKKEVESLLVLISTPDEKHQR